MSLEDHEWFVSGKLLPKGFEYPSSYVDYVNEKGLDLNPWHFFYSKLDYRYKGMASRYPEKLYVPFARMKGSDDVACFDAKDSSDDKRVIIVHDFASPGWEARLELNNFEDWLAWAKRESMTGRDQ